VDLARSQTGPRLVAALSLLLALLGGIAIWLSESDNGQPSAAATPPFSLPVVQHVDHDQATTFSSLRTPPEGLPMRVRRIMRNQPSFGMNWNLAQGVSTTWDGELWLVPGTKFLCILWLSTSSLLRQGCAPTQIAISHGLAVVALTADPRNSASEGSRAIIGIAPDGATQVLVHTGESIVRRAVGDEGVFTLRDSIDSPPDRLTFAH
jgi:hypothetical protein